MPAIPGALHWHQIPVLLRGESEAIRSWIARWHAGRTVLYLAVILVGTGLFGAAMGSWRAPLQSWYTAVKFPLVILLTTSGNALLNGLLAPLLGLNLRFRQSLLAILMSFTIAAAILGAFSPIVFFMVWNTPPIDEQLPSSQTAHHLLLLTQVVIIAFAGLAANVRLLQLLRQLGGSDAVARKILFAWLAGNLLLGGQLSWILRPFIGSPQLPVQFLRANALQGNFFESVWHTAANLF